MKNNGWVKFHRQIEDNFLWFLEKFTKAQAWMDLVLNANHKDGIINIRGNIIHIKRGQIGWSELTMAKRWTWSKNKVRRFLKLLETEQQIEQQKDRFITTIITITNYNKYQNDTTDDKAERQQKDSRRYINKKDKNVKNDKKNIIYMSYKKFINSNSRDTDKGKLKIKARLKVFTEDELLKAMNNFSKNSWNMEHNSSRGVAWFFHTDDRIDGFLNLKEEKQIKNYIR